MFSKCNDKEAISKAIPKIYSDGQVIINDMIANYYKAISDGIHM